MRILEKDSEKTICVGSLEKEGRTFKGGGGRPKHLSPKRFLGHEEIQSSISDTKASADLLKGAVF